MYILPDFVPLFPGYRDKGVELLVLFFSIPLTSQEGRELCGFSRKKAGGGNKKFAFFAWLSLGRRY